MPGPYNRWYVAVGLGVATIVSYGITQYLFGVLVVPIQHDLGASRAAVSGAFSGSVAVWGLLGVPVGRLVDRYGARWLMTAGSLLGAGSLFALARIHTLWQLYLLWSGGLGLAMALTLYSVTFTVIANFFVARRGTALAVLTTIGGLSSPIYIPASGWLVAHLGWRHSLDVLALTVLLVALPIHALVVRRPPAAAVLEGTPLGHALRGRVFWLLTLAAGLSLMAATVVFAHAVAFLISRSYPAVTAAGLVGLVGLASLPGRFVFNVVSDRFGPQGLLALCTFLQGVGLVALLMAGPSIWVFAFVAVYGLAFGAISPLRAAVNAEHFGRRAYGAITGAQNLPTQLLSAVGPLLAGYLYDVLGNYHVAFSLTAGAFFAAALLILLTPRAESAGQLGVEKAAGSL